MEEVSITEPEFVGRQIRAVAGDLGVAGVKCGTFRTFFLRRDLVYPGLLLELRLSDSKAIGEERCVRDGFHLGHWTNCRVLCRNAGIKGDYWSGCKGVREVEGPWNRDPGA